MNEAVTHRNRIWSQLKVSVFCALFALATIALSGGGVVTECTEANLRSAMVGGGTVGFVCSGVIDLETPITNQLDTVLDGAGQQVTIRGTNGAFYVPTNATLSLANLMLSYNSSEKGGAIFIDGGTLNLSQVRCENNTATCLDGGAIYSIAGTLSATNCQFAGNVAQASGGCAFAAYFGGPSRGGAICMVEGTAIFEECVFSNNQAVGPPGFQMFYGSGHLIGTPGGDGYGGAIYNSRGTLEIRACTFQSNVAIGSAAGDMASSDPYAGGWPGQGGGSGFGGAVYCSGTTTIHGSLFANNNVIAGRGGSGGPPWQDVSGPMPAGPDGPSGLHNGGALMTSGTASLWNSTLTANYEAIYDIANSLRLTNCTLVFNGSGVHTVGGILLNTLLASNSPNCVGTINDLGHNLSSDASCAFTNICSRNNTDPKLGPLADNGGPTLTMALQAGSPAIDAGDNTAAPPTDQRGVPRPFGAAADIGAYEYAALLRISRTPANILDLLLYDGMAGEPCRLLSSTTLSNWVCVATNQIGTNGTCLFQDQCNPTEPQRFYKVAVP